MSLPRTRTRRQRAESGAFCTCVVCHEPLVEATAVGDVAPLLALHPCGHEFHAACVLPWVQQQKEEEEASCPLCRAPCQRGAAAAEAATASPPPPSPPAFDLSSLAQSIASDLHRRMRWEVLPQMRRIEATLAARLPCTSWSAHAYVVDSFLYGALLPIVDRLFMVRHTDRNDVYDATRLFDLARVVVEGGMPEELRDVLRQACVATPPDEPAMHAQMRRFLSGGASAYRLTLQQQEDDGTPWAVSVRGGGGELDPRPISRLVVALLTWLSLAPRRDDDPHLYAPRMRVHTWFMQHQALPHAPSCPLATSESPIDRSTTGRTWWTVHASPQ